jgi:hypothetical protein
MTSDERLILTDETPHLTNEIVQSTDEIVHLTDEIAESTDEIIQFIPSGKSGLRSLPVFIVVNALRARPDRGYIT